jgi:ABC-type multidrug transport system fused ATPase/permease subunit
MDRLYSNARRFVSFVAPRLIPVIVVVYVALVPVVLKAVLNLWTSASQQVQAAVIVTSGTILVSVASLILSKRAEQRREIEQEQRAKKAQVYEEFLDHWFAVMRGVREELPEGERKEMEDNYYGSVPPQMVAWASEAVLREYAAHAAPLGSEDEEGSIFDFERVLFTGTWLDLECNIRKLRKADLSVQDLVSQQESLAALWIINELKW